MRRDPAWLFVCRLLRGAALGALILAAAGRPAIAAEAKGDIESLRAELARSFPDVARATISATPVTGLYEVQFEGEVIYASRDGRYLFTGDDLGLIDLKTRTNLTEQTRGRIVVRTLAEVPESEMIVIGPKNPKRTLTVFTDVDCPYCARFHLDVPELNRHGVQVRYLLFPRGQSGSTTYRRSVGVWCAADRVKAVGIAKAGGEIELKDCPNPVDRHVALGRRLGVNGTPTIFIDDGRKIGGYVPAERMLAFLGLRPATAAAR